MERGQTARLDTVFDQALGQELAAQARTAVATPLPLKRLTPGDAAGKKRLLRLSEIIPTSTLNTELQNLQQTLETDQQMRTSTRRKLEDHVDFVQRQLVLAAERDRVQATRPEGCWCLGLGGRGLVALDTLGDPNEAPTTWTEYCSCPEGDAAKAERDRVQDKWVVDVRVKRITRILGHRKYGRYANHTFETYLEAVKQKAGRVPREATNAIKLLRGWAKQSDTWLYVWGSFGTGKTGALCVLAIQLMDRHPDVIFTTVGAMFETIQATFNVQPGGDEPTTEQVLQMYRDTSLLIVDDLANDNESPTPFAVRTFWRLINDRYNGPKLTAFSSNCSPEELERRIGPALSQRILEDCIEVDMTGCPNLRSDESED